MTYTHAPDDARFNPFVYWFYLAKNWAMPGLCVPLAVAGTLRTRPGGERSASAGATAEIGWVCAVYLGVLACMPFRVERYLVVITPLTALVVVRWLRDLPERFPRWLLPLALATTLPAAAFHYFSPAPVQPDLLAAAHDLGRDLPPDETPVFCAGMDASFEVAGFTAFYANLSRPWSELGPAEIRALPAPCRGLCHAPQWAELSRVCPTVRQRAVHRDWIVWECRD